jgi:subtilase family serine protease
MLRARVVLGASAVALSAAAAAVIPAAAGLAPGAPSPLPPAAAGTTAMSALAVNPDVIRVPRAASAAPPSTADCEAADSVACYVPDQIRTAYNLPALYARGGTGKGVTIMIVDPFGSPTIKADLAAFDKTFGYNAPPKFTVIAPVGKIPPFNPKNSGMAGWAGETSLDVEYAHALAPGANILLVETPVSETEGTAGFPQIVAAEKYALAHYKVGVISQSFSATEATFASSRQLAPLRAAYTDAQSHGVTVLAGSGDSGATNYQANGTSFYNHRVTGWPATDPLVTAVGGTQLEQTGTGYSSVGWNDSYNPAVLRGWTGSTTPAPFASGGGSSVFFTRPSWQNVVAGRVGGHRAVPDISMSAACDGAVDVYSTYAAKGWSQVCGTSEATPEFAAVVAIADQVAGRSLGLINPTLYRLAAGRAAGIVDVTAGNNTVAYTAGGKQVTVKGYTAASGYDAVTGVGTLNAFYLSYELSGRHP